MGRVQMQRYCRILSMTSNSFSHNRIEVAMETVHTTLTTVHNSRRDNCVHWFDASMVHNAKCSWFLSNRQHNEHLSQQRSLFFFQRLERGSWFLCTGCSTAEHCSISFFQIPLFLFFYIYSITYLTFRFSIIALSSSFNTILFSLILHPIEQNTIAFSKFDRLLGKCE